MKFKMILTDVVEKEINNEYIPKEIYIDYNDDLTLKDVREKLDLPTSGIFFDKYYHNGYFRFSNNELPYILKKEGIVEFSPVIDNILISEFLNTHHISDLCISAEYGIPMAGGPGLIEWEVVWKTVYEVINTISIFGTFIMFIDFLRSKFKKSEPRPHELIDFLYKKYYWNHYELAQILQIEDENAQNLLKAFGYSWNNSKKMYVISEEKMKEYSNIINNIDIFKY